MIKLMRAPQVLIDTGPLVAWFNPNDADHSRCVAALNGIRPPMLLCWPVIVETAWLLRDRPGAVSRMLLAVDDRLLSLVDLAASELPSIDAIMSKYSDLSPQLTDAAIVHLAQREGIETIFTLDRRDFMTYRLPGRKKFRLLPEV